jgi:hypothetical protein
VMAKTKILDKCAFKGCRKRRRGHGNAKYCDEHQTVMEKQWRDTCNAKKRADRKAAREASKKNVKVCPQCNTNPVPAGCRKCTACTTANAKASTQIALKNAEAKRSAARAEVNKNHLCLCGCGVQVKPPMKYTPDCRAAQDEVIRLRHLAALKATRERKAAAKVPKPEVAAKTAIAKASQTAIDSAIQAAYLKRSGMDKVNECRTLTPAEIADLQRQGAIKYIGDIPHRSRADERFFTGYCTTNY